MMQRLIIIHVLIVTAYSAVIISTPTPDNTIEIAENQCANEQICSPYHFCEKSSRISLDTNFIEVDMNEGQPNECGDFLKTCCNIKNQVKTPRVKLSRTTDECGYSNPKGVGYTITSNDKSITQLGQFPWMAAILKVDKNLSESYFCGGSLIHPFVVLSTAECALAEPKENIKIRVGEWNFKSNGELLQHQDLLVSETLIHENFTGPVYKDNIALFILESAAEIGENVKTGCVPAPGVRLFYKNCISIGWEQFSKEINPNDFSAIMKKLPSTVTMSNEDCLNKLSNTDFGSKVKPTDNLICATNAADKDNCFSVAGSPLLCPVPSKLNQYYQVGMELGVSGCSRPNEVRPQLDISLYRDWVDQIIDAKGLSRFSYSAYQREDVIW